MGSIITLEIEGMLIDVGKNDFFLNHSCLFQKEDLKMIPYDDEDRKGFSKSINSVKKRLDLLGYSLNQIKDIFNKKIKYINQLNDVNLPIKFEDYYKVVKNINICNIEINDENDFYLSNYIKEYLIDEIKKNNKISGDSIFAIENTLEDFLEKLPQYVTLRILAENQSNQKLELIWKIADVIENGWILEKDIIPVLSPKEKILIVTEGSSDTDIIKKSIDFLYKDISDFFEFIDMKKNYPFTGTGNLKNFIKGLSKINILNNILVILDNDNAGLAVFNDIKKINLPKNIKVITLPELKDFNRFKCKGAKGDSYENINGKAVSIECFLDHNFIKKEIYVKKTESFDELSQFQGNIEPKQLLIKSFHENYCKGKYNFSKIKYLINHILKKLDY